MAKLKVEGEEVRLIQDVPTDEFIRTINSKTLQPSNVVYVLDGYNRSMRRYELHEYEDINHTIFLKKDRKVLVGFTY